LRWITPPLAPRSSSSISKNVIAALCTAFDKKQQLTTEILLAEIHSTQPLSVTRSEEIQSIRAWAKTRTVPAD
jgi:hypothetical protein